MITRKFEYLVCILSEKNLNELGLEGWELIFVDGLEYVFKREIFPDILEEYNKTQNSI